MTFNPKAELWDATTRLEEALHLVSSYKQLADDLVSEAQGDVREIQQRFYALRLALDDQIAALHEIHGDVLRVWPHMPESAELITTKPKEAYRR